MKLSFEEEMNIRTPPNGPRKNSLDDSIEEFLFEEKGFVETAIQEEYEGEENDIRVNEKEDYSDSSEDQKPKTPNNSNYSMYEMKTQGEKRKNNGDEFIYDFF